jgi:hypothetical protein
VVVPYSKVIAAAELPDETDEICTVAAVEPIEKELMVPLTVGAVAGAAVVNVWSLP